jgi:hypothetical protein
VNELLLRQLDEVRGRLNTLTKRVKAATRVAGKGAAELSAVLGGVTLKLARAQSLPLFDPSGLADESPAA